MIHKTRSQLEGGEVGVGRPEWAGRSGQVGKGRKDWSGRRERAWAGRQIEAARNELAVGGRERVLMGWAVEHVASVR